MMLGEISAEGLALWITGVAAAVGTAAFGLYALYRRTMRQEETADNKAKLEAATDDATFWQRQYELKCQSDLQWQARVAEKIDQIEKRHAALEADHFVCQEDHAKAKGQIASMQRDLEAKDRRIADQDRRIADLERLVGKT